MAKKAKQKKPRRGAKKITAKAKSTGKKAGLKRKAARKPAARRRPVRETQALLGSQSVPTVPLKHRARTAAAGAKTTCRKSMTTKTGRKTLAF